MSDQYKNTMWLTTIYLAILGIVFIIAPDFARNFLSIELDDAGLTLIYGQVILSLGFMAYLVANNPKLSGMVLGFLVLFLGQAIIFAYLLGTGQQSFVQLGSPLMFSLIETILLYRVYKAR